MDKLTPAQLTALKAVRDYAPLQTSTMYTDVFTPGKVHLEYLKLLVGPVRKESDFVATYKQLSDLKLLNSRAVMNFNPDTAQSDVPTEEQTKVPTEEPTEVPTEVQTKRPTETTRESTSIPAVKTSIAGKATRPRLFNLATIVARLQGQA